MVDCFLEVDLVWRLVSCGKLFANGDVMAEEWASSKLVWRIKDCG